MLSPLDMCITSGHTDRRRRQTGEPTVGGTRQSARPSLEFDRIDLGPPIAAADFTSIGVRWPVDRARPTFEGPASVEPGHWKKAMRSCGR